MVRKHQQELQRLEHEALHEQYLCINPIRLTISKPNIQPCANAGDIISGRVVWQRLLLRRTFLLIVHRRNLNVEISSTASMKDR